MPPARAFFTKAPQKQSAFFHAHVICFAHGEPANARPAPKGMFAMKRLSIIIIIAAAIWLFWQSTQAPAPPPSAPARPAPSATQPPAATPSQPAPPPAQAAPAAPNTANRLAALAQSSGLRVTGFMPQAGGAAVTVEWISDNASQGMDFIQAAMQQGIIRDFDMNPAMNERIVDGRRAFIARYQVRF